MIYLQLLGADHSAWAPHEERGTRGFQLNHPVFFLNSVNRGGEDSSQWGFMEAIEEYEFGEWNLYWKILDNKVSKLLKNRKKLSKYDNRQENDDIEEDDGIIILGNKFKSIRI